MRSIKALKAFSERSLAVLAALAFGSSALLMTACNTTEGAGEDIEAAGESIQDAAN